MKPTARTPARWLLLIHQIPPKPAYFRAKVGRRLHQIGAVAIKNSVYVLPRDEQTQEDMQWVAREIVAEGGDATLCTANLVEGLRDAQVEALFQAARDADYSELGASTRAATDEAELARLRKRLAEIVALDFFGAPGASRRKRRSRRSRSDCGRARLAPPRRRRRGARPTR